jgi:hypothetical protein
MNNEIKTIWYEIESFTHDYSHKQFKTAFDAQQFIDKNMISDAIICRRKIEK